MKAITMILLTIFLGKGCSQEVKNDLANTQIIYSANTRGFFQKITIKNQMVTVSNDRNNQDGGTPKKISDTDWKKLVSAFETVQLESLSTYKDPTQKRFYDGAAMANMTITYKEKEYQTTTFDHGTPPVEIADFVNKVVSLVKDEE